MSRSKKEKSLENTYKFIKMVSGKQGWKLNPDPDFLEMLAQGLMKNYNRYEYFSCPCRDAEGIREMDEDIICPCVYCPPDQDEYGYCYCGLFLLPEFFNRGIAPVQIPERRDLK